MLSFKKYEGTMSEILVKYIDSILDNGYLTKYEYACSFNDDTIFRKANIYVLKISRLVYDINNTISSIFIKDAQGAEFEVLGIIKRDDIKLNIGDTFICLGCLYAGSTGYLTFNAPKGYYIRNDLNCPISSLNIVSIIPIDKKHIEESYQKISDVTRLYFKEIPETNIYNEEDDEDPYYPDDDEYYNEYFVNDNYINNILREGYIIYDFDEASNNSGSNKPNPNIKVERDEIKNAPKLYIAVCVGYNNVRKIYKTDIPAYTEKLRESYLTDKVKKLICDNVKEKHPDYTSIKYMIAKRSSKYLNNEIIINTRNSYKKIFFEVNPNTFEIINKYTGYLRDKESTYRVDLIPTNNGEYND